MIFDDNDTYPWDQEPNANKDTFLDSLPLESYNKLGKFFEDGTENRICSNIRKQ